MHLLTIHSLWKWQLQYLPKRYLILNIRHTSHPKTEVIHWWSTVMLVIHAHSVSVFTVFQCDCQLWHDKHPTNNPIRCNVWDVTSVSTAAIFFLCHLNVGKGGWNTASLSNPHNKNSNVVKSGDQGGYAVGPHWPIRCPGTLFTNSWKSAWKYRSEPSFKDFARGTSRPTQRVLNSQLKCRFLCVTNTINWLRHK